MWEELSCLYNVVHIYTILCIQILELIMSLGHKDWLENSLWLAGSLASFKLKGFGFNNLFWLNHKFT